VAILATASFGAPSPAGADSLIDESFTGSALTNSGWVTGGSGGTFPGWPGGACLTAGTDTTATAGPGCNLDAPDAADDGTLRLTTSEGSLTGFAIYNTALPTRFGIDVTFKFAQWGGTGGGGADGLSMFFTKGSTNLTTAGWAGGNLGYRGITDGLLGIGFDSYGSFANNDSQGSECPPSPGGTSGVRDQIAVRGPGSGADGFCWIDGTGELDYYLAGDTRAESEVSVRVVVDPDTVAERKVTITYERGGSDPISGTIEVDLPEEFLNESTFKFGFAGSTGADTNFHEVWDVKVASVDPVIPDPTTPTTEPPAGPSGPSPSPDADGASPAAVVPRYTG
jgi:hypothetical protein